MTVVLCPLRHTYTGSVVGLRLWRFHVPALRMKYEACKLFVVRG